MHNLKTGQFYGTTNETTRLDGVTLTDTEYTHLKVDWHYHENPYFTFILQGKVIEGNKKETYNCSAGTLLFHNWHDAHYNIKPDGFTRGFHIELERKWFDSFEINAEKLQGSINISNPLAKTLMYDIFRESKMGDTTGKLAIDTLLVTLLDQISGTHMSPPRSKPGWVVQLRELLNCSDEDWKLRDLAKTLSIHPVHLSRDFSKHFNCSLGDYIRAIRVQRALAFLPDADLSLTDIAMRCHFADQSHFIRSFKSLHKITPLQYRKILMKAS